MWFSLGCGRCCKHEQNTTEVAVDKIVKNEYAFADESLDPLFVGSHPNLLSSLNMLSSPSKAAAGLEKAAKEEAPKKPAKEEAAAGLEKKAEEEATKKPARERAEGDAGASGKPEAQFLKVSAIYGHGVRLDGFQFRLRLVRENPKEEKLGVDLRNSGTPFGLVVQKVMQKGLIPRWNEEHPEREVRVGDIITSVNKAAGTESMYAAILRDLEFDVTVIRKEESAA